MGMFKEFKEFVMCGNVIDFVVGVVIGGVFGKIVILLVNDVIMLLIGLFIGGVDFLDMKWVFKFVDNIDLVYKVVEVVVNYGMFINMLIQFLIVVFVIFLLVKVINCFSCKQEEVVLLVVLLVDVVLLIEICDLLKNCLQV